MRRAASEQPDMFPSAGPKPDIARSPGKWRSTYDAILTLRRSGLSVYHAGLGKHYVSGFGTVDDRELRKLGRLFTPG